MKSSSIHTTDREVQVRVITEYCKIRSDKSYYTNGQNASVLHDLLRSHQLANGKDIPIPVGAISGDRKTEKDIWEDYEPALSPYWTAQFLLKTREVPVFHTL